MTYARTNTPKIDDAEILQWINRGLLVVCTDLESEQIEVWKWHGRRLRYEQLKVYTCDEDGRRRCNVCIGTKDSEDYRQRTVYLNKLVWMFFRREVVPDGYVLDHENEICTDDRFDNLRLMTEEESDRQGRNLQYIRQREQAVEEYGEF